MSLNGLDTSAVVEAHQSALTDPGGWFILKYASRDTVEVLNRGNGGVTEAKSAVEKYEEKSPLYGMVQYRRKRVLLKYVPEGTSRLLQVRLTVQFQSILDAFPHDTIFSFTAAPELVESALGLCTMLQPTNTGSLKSSNSSLRQRRLNEISEDVEDVSMVPKYEEAKPSLLELRSEMPASPPSEASTLPASALRAKALLAKRKEESNEIVSQPAAEPLINPINLTTPVPEQPQLIVSKPPRSVSSLSQLRARDEAESVISTAKLSPESIEHLTKDHHNSRHLSVNESESISQWNAQVAEYTIPVPKPKKKLAPRPHVENPSRPKTASSYYEDKVVARPIANLPQTVRVSNRVSTNLMTRPGSQQSSRSVPARFLPTQSLAPPLPDFGQIPNTFLRPDSRRAGSVTSSNVAEVPAASPEKMRLMKALQKRKRNQLLAQRTASSQSSYADSPDGFPLDTPNRPDSIQAPAIPTVIQEETVPAAQDTKSIQGSSTASPTSLTTLSTNPSTRPSSLAEDQDGRSSKQSGSLDTDSSSTPKAVAENASAHRQKHTSWFDSAPELGGNRNGPPSVSPSGNTAEESHSRDTETPTAPEPRAGQITPTQIDRSALSWLANDSDINIIQSLVQTAQPTPPRATQSSNLLHVDHGIQPMTETSSVVSDDDAFADELQSATVHEAKPVSVSRPPLTPTMRTFSVDRSRAATTSSLSITPKSTKSTSIVHEKSPGNSLHNSSTALPQWPRKTEEEPVPVPLSKKSTLGHGISKRIKALEDVSRKDNSAHSSPPAQDTTAARSTFSTLMKRTSFISQFQNSTANNESSPPIVDRSSVSRPVTQRKPSVTEVQSTRPVSERVPSRLPAIHPMDQDRHFSTTSDAPIPTYEVPSSPSASEKKRFSFASYRSGSTAKWMHSESMASRLSLVSQGNRHGRPTPSEASSVNEEKRGSRASRLMKRMSGFGSRLGGKGSVSSAAREDFRPDPIMEHGEGHARSESASESLMQMIDIGNVNVQFPETLLWKRRFLRIDDQGYLIFSAPTEYSGTRSTSRKFHLGDIQEPCLPDMEREEIAWSVLLDLRDGNCIQCACESRQAQARVLKMLLDAHSAFHSLYPDALD